MTPLGSAITNHMVISTRELYIIFKPSSLPHISSFSGASRWRSSSCHPVEQLINHFYLDNHQRPKISLVLLRELLQFFPAHTVLGVNFIQNMLCYPIDFSGIDIAIRHGDLEAIKLILESIEEGLGIDISQLRLLLWGDDRQWSTSNEAAVAVTEEIWTRCDSKFRDMRRQRQIQSHIRMIWRV